MGEAGIYAEFYVEAVEQPVESAKQGRKVYKDEDWVKLHFADGKTVLPKRVDEDIRIRWKPEYEAWLDKREAPIEGTPLDQWPQVSPAEIRALYDINVRSVEELTQISEQIVSMVPGGTKLQQKANAWLQSAASHGQVAEQMREMQEQIAALQKDNEMLASQAAIAEAKSVRPKKAKKEPVEYPETWHLRKAFAGKFNVFSPEGVKANPEPMVKADAEAFLQEMKERTAGDVPVSDMPGRPEGVAVV